jgi:hypothetical protein
MGDDVMHISSIRAGSFLLVVLGCLVSFGAARNSGLQKSSQISGVPDTASLNANRVLVMLNNRGSLDSRLLPAGGFWLYQQQEFPFNNPILYDAGIGLIGKIGGTVRLGLTQWGSSYAPGPIIDGKPALWVRPQDAARFRPYKISRGDSASSNPDYAEWPRDLGAPLDDQGMPKLYADQTIWMVYNDADSSARPMEWDRAAPFPHAALEIHQLAYSRRSTLCDSAAMLANVVFFEWTIINKEPAGIDSAFAIIWTDIDFLGADANIPAIDTLRQLPYCWDTDPSVGTAPPGRMAVGYMPLRGPILPSSNDTAIFRGTTRPGYRNLHMTSFWPILDDAGPDSGKFFFPARTTEHLWNVARGFDKDGPALVDPTTGQATKFPYGGDPVTGTGWVWQKNEGRGGGAGFYAFFGPFMMAPNDTQWLQAALVPALGKDHFDAIQVLRYQAEQLLTMPYDTLLSGHFNHIFCEGPFVPSAIQLFQNYPNPFNAGTKIAYDIDQPTHVRVTVYDLLGREIAVLIDGQRTPGRYSVDFTGRGLASGVYFYRLQTTTTSMTRKLVLLR